MGFMEENKGRKKGKMGEMEFQAIYMGLNATTSSHI